MPTGLVGRFPDERDTYAIPLLVCQPKFEDPTTANSPRVRLHCRSGARQTRAKMSDI